MAYMTEETMDEMAQWMHDSAWETPEAIDPEVIKPGDIADCVHDGANVTKYADKAGTYFGVWECGTCGHVGELGKES
jgi:hypothetical protein